VDAEALKNAYEAIKQKEEAKMSSAQWHSGNECGANLCIFYTIHLFQHQLLH